ncbi:type II toxin-antitoxin system HicB family antitoxin [Peribacillus frigoritolerans]|uniref:type II toxin-antitoxin system HicB family antitoxin n=1 Tax=Peribacillus frigoritolerans TaxID=450367 RepID=UPI0025A0445D|nr:type II toxin-antitoxin system HicB family antitoxin [Peribacillus frigoritolerans]MDM5313369.1 type II toxin-antitoxin system HicB family antitoxin [Peribacillus frigoritolerans]
MPMYKYYGVFEKDVDGVSVSFPDLQGCLTCGDDMQEALAMAEDVLGGYLLLSEEDNEAIPAPSSPKEINKIPKGASLILIEVNTDDFKGL